MSKCLAIITADGLEPTAQTNSTLTAIKLALLQKQAEQNFAPNDEIWITETCDWEVPFDGTYEILAIDGGSGAYVNTTYRSAMGGLSGAYKQAIVNLVKGQVIPISIGAGGIGSSDDIQSILGGVTTVGDIDFSFYTTAFFESNNLSLPTGVTAFNIQSAGSGFGGGNSKQNGKWWGAGGGGAIQSTNGTTFTTEIHNGRQGAVRFRFFNPTKASIPSINDTDLIPYLTLLQRLEAIEEQLNINS